MNGLGTTDVSRILDSIKQRWWVVVTAAVVGAVLGLAWSSSTRPVSYSSTVATPPLQSLDAISATTTVAIQPQLEEIATTLMSDATRAALGSVVDGASVSATPAVEKTSITVVVSAASDDIAKRAATAYAAEAARLYRDRGNTMLAFALDSVEAGIKSIDEGRAGAAAADTGAATAKRAELVVRKEMLQNLVERPPVATSISQVASSGSKGTAIVTLAMLLAAAAAAIVGLLGLNNRRLRYRDDVEDVVGPDRVLAHVRKEGDLAAVRSMLARMTAKGRVRLVRVDGSQIAMPGAELASETDLEADQILVAALGIDTRADLDLAYRTATAGHGKVAGVIAVASGVLVQMTDPASK